MSADLNCVFGTAQNVFSAQSTVFSTDWIDIKKAQDMAGGVAPVLEIIVTTTFVGATALLKFEIHACDASGAGQGMLDTTDFIAVALLVAPTGTPPMGGKRILLKMSPKLLLPTAAATHLRVACTTAIANTTAGAVTWHLTNEAATADPVKSYAVGY